MKTKVINLELLYLDFENTTQELLVKFNRKYAVEEMQQAKNDGYNSIVFLLLIDGFLYKNNQEFHNTLEIIRDSAKEIGFQSISFMPGMAESFDTEENIIFFDYYVWMIYQSYKDIKTNQWNDSSNKFLFLNGQPARVNRIYLTSLFHKKDLLKDNLYSFFPPWTDDDIKWCKECLGYSEKDYNTFIEECQQTFDTLYDESKNYSKLDGPGLLKEKIYDKPWVKDPGLIDLKFFSQTCFSVISEGNAYYPATDYFFLTEKTWRAVVNNHPFIIAGYKEQVLYAKQRGLETFEKYFDIKDYYLIEDEKERMKAVVHNTEHFLKNFKKYSNEIKLDVKHNYDLFFKIVEENKQTIKNFEKEDIEKYFISKTWTNLIRIPKI